MVRRLLEFLRTCSGDRSGSVMVVFAVTLVPVLLGIGMSVDYSRALAAKQRLSQTIDAAALAAGSWPDLNESQITAKAQEYISANFPSTIEGNPDQITVSKTDDILTITATSHVDTIFMKLAGINRVDVNSFTEVSLKQKKIELVMVLDNTGSMGWSGKLTALKDAAKLLIENLKSGSGSSANNDDVKIGLVPFAAAVNIGADKLNSGWIDTNAQSSIAGEDFAPGVNVLDLYNQINNQSWNGCVRARPVPYDTQDNSPGAGTPDTLWVPYFAPDEPDVGSSYYNRYASDSGYTGSTYDYDARQRYTGKYTSLTNSNKPNDGPDFNCLVPTVTPLTQIKGDAISAVETMIASGSTVIPAGLSWGWRLISPTEPFTEGVAYDDPDVVKAIILLTDGRNDVGGGLSNHNKSFYNAYGYAQSGNLGNVNGWESESKLDAKTSTLCTNIKAEGVRLYTITFQLGDGPIKDLLRNCATETSMYYDSPSNEQLDSVFENIAKGLNDLRLSK